MKGLKPGRKMKRWLNERERQKTTRIGKVYLSLIFSVHNHSFAFQIIENNVLIAGAASLAPARRRRRPKL